MTGVPDTNSRVINLTCCRTEASSGDRRTVLELNNKMEALAVGKRKVEESNKMKHRSGAN